MNARTTLWTFRFICVLSVILSSQLILRVTDLVECWTKLVIAREFGEL